MGVAAARKISSSLSSSFGLTQTLNVREYTRVFWSSWLVADS